MIVVGLLLEERKRKSLVYGQNNISPAKVNPTDNKQMQNTVIDSVIMTNRAKLRQLANAKNRALLRQTKNAKKSNVRNVAAMVWLALVSVSALVIYIDDNQHPQEQALLAFAAVLLSSVVMALSYAVCAVVIDHEINLKSNAMGLETWTVSPV